MHQPISIAKFEHLPLTPFLVVSSGHPYQDIQLCNIEKYPSKDQAPGHIQRLHLQARP
jgi:hypothetical protein